MYVFMITFTIYTFIQMMPENKILQQLNWFENINSMEYTHYALQGRS